MATNEVLLLKPIEGLGSEGDQVTVKAGYARNYLLPQKLALPVTQANRKQIEALKRVRAEREARELEGAKALAEKIAAVKLAFAVKTGEGGKMFGSVSVNEVHAKLLEAGVEIDKRKLHLSPVKELGAHTLTIKLHPEVKAELSFEVVSENPIEEAAPAEEAKEEKKARKPRKAKADAEKPAAQAQN